MRRTPLTLIGGLALVTSVVCTSTVPAQAAPVESSWSTSIPDLSDGTYRCTATRTDANGLASIQDCTRAVAGGHWQTVTIIRNNSTHSATATVVVDSIRNGATVGSVICSGTVPNKAHRACWGATRKDPGAWIQAYDNGIMGSYSGTFDGVVYLLVADPSYSPTRQVPK